MILNRRTYSLVLIGLGLNFPWIGSLGGLRGIIFKFYIFNVLFISLSYPILILLRKKRDFIIPLNRG